MPSGGVSTYLSKRALFQAPAGTVLGGKRIGGSFMNMARAQTALRETELVAASTQQVALQPIFTWESRLPFIEAAIGVRCHASCEETAKDVLLDAKSNLAIFDDHPYATGFLADSLEIAELDKVADYAIFSDVDYAPYVEFGTQHAPPHPYIWPAVQKNQPKMIAKQQRAIAEACA